MSVPFYISFIVIMGYNHMSFVGITEDIFNEKDGYNLLGNLLYDLCCNNWRFV